MAENEDYLFRPVQRGYIRAETLVDPAYDLAFIALCNEAIDVHDENTRRTERHRASQGTRR